MLIWSEDKGLVKIKELENEMRKYKVEIIMNGNKTLTKKCFTKIGVSYWVKKIFSKYYIDRYIFKLYKNDNLQIFDIPKKLSEFKLSKAPKKFTYVYE